MELEHMRETLATLGMGWTECVCRGLHGLPEAGWKTDDYGRIIAQADWRPDENWTQCGMVIEAMRGAMWRDDMTWLPDGWFEIRFNRGDVWGESSSDVDGAMSEPHARMLAAARALEANDEQG